MTFADRSILAALVALAIPLAIHLLGRRRARKVLLPTARFAQGAHQAARGALWLRRLGLLASRLAVVALLVLAVAGPRLGGTGTGSGDGGPWVLVLDGSPGMRTRGADGRTRLDAARARLLALAAALPPDAAATLVLPDGRTAGETATAVRRALEGAADPGWDAEPPARLLACAAAVLAATREKGGAAGGRIVLATDAAPWALRDLAPGALGDLDADVVVLAVGGRVRNAWLGLPETRVAGDARGRTLEVTVAARAAAPGDPLDVSLRLDGQAGDHTVRLPPGAAEARFRLPLAGDGPWQGRVWTADDALPADSVRFFTAAAHAPVRVLVVDAADEKGAAVRSADLVAATFGGDTPRPKRVARRRAADLAAGDLAGADVVFWVGSRAPADVKPLEALAARAGLVWVPADASAPAAALAAVLGIGPAPRLREDPDGVTLDPAGYTSDLLAAFEAGTSGDLSAPVFHRRLALEAGGGAALDAGGDAALRFRDASAAAVARSRGGGRTVALAFGPAPCWGDLAGRAEFVVLAHSLAEALAPAAGPQAANLVLGRGSPGLAGAGAEPGNAVRTAEKGGRAYVSVNIDPDATADLTPQPPRLAAALAAAAPGGHVRLGGADFDTAAASSGLARAGGTDLALVLAAALALAVAAESLLGSARAAAPAAR